MDIRRIGKASVPIIVLGVVLVLLQTMFHVLPSFLEPSDAEIAEMIDTVFTFFAVLLFMALYALAGFRAVKKFGLDPMGAGQVAALSYTTVAIINLLINTIVELLIVNHILDITGFRTAEAAVTAAVLDHVSGGGGVLISSLCGLGIIIIGALMNFIVGALAGIYARHRR